MKYIRYLMALAVMFAMITGWASAGSVIQMPGGTQSWTEGNGGTAGWAHSFYVDQENLADVDADGYYRNWLQADILSVASTTGKGSASVTTEVPTTVSYTVKNDPTVDPTDYKLTVSAQGTVDSTVASTDADAQVTSVAGIGSYAESYQGDSQNYYDEGTYGNAYIYSAIGDQWSEDFAQGMNPDYQLGYMYNNPDGQFEATSRADGTATYSAQKDSYTLPDVDFLSSGKVDGTTTLEAAVSSDYGTIGSYLGGFETAEPAVAYVEAYSNSYNDPTIGDPVSFASVDNEVNVAAANDVCTTGAGNAYAAGTSEGASSAEAVTQYCTGYECDQLTATASKEDSMSADVNVENSADTAAASTDLYANGYVSLLYGSHAYSYADVYGYATRKNAGSDSSGADRVWGEAFIGTGSWNADATHTTAVSGSSDDVDTYAAVSGELGTITDPTIASGMGAGTFLQYKKNGPASSELYLTQSADSYIDGSKHTKILGYADISGPKAESLGSSSWDGSGVYGAFENLNAESSRDIASYYDPTSGSISVNQGEVKSYMWVDGTNDLMYNGPGFESDVPTFDPAGYGWNTGLTWAFTPSPTQRETTVTFGVGQN